MELFKAHSQWSTRPADERFSSLVELHDVTLAYRNTAGQMTIPVSELRVEKIGEDIQLVGRKNVPAKLTHWAFGQMASRIGAPADYLRCLPPTLACQNISHGLARLEDRDARVNLLFHENGSLLLRAITSDQYARIWNYEVAERLLDLETKGWRPAIPTIRQQGDDKPALYASDHDMFAFITHSSAVIKEAGTTEPLFRGVIVENSEVGAKALKLTRFLYRAICGNFIIWGAQNVLEISVRHVGKARDRWHGYEAELHNYASTTATADEAKIAAAKRCMIGDSKEQVLDRLFGMRSVGLSRKTLTAGYEAALLEIDGDPRTIWGMVNGLTRHSQKTQFADERFNIDRAAGRLMEVNF